VSSSSGELTTLDDVRVAAEVVDGVVRATPVLRPANLSNLAGRPLVLKCEQLQRTGSFKLRGAYRRISELDTGTEVVAASAGNHAQGVALAASLRGLRSTIFMPETASLPKVQATRDYGAEVVLSGSFYDDAVRAAGHHARRVGTFFVPAFDDPLVIAGQGTVGLELADQAPEVETFVIAVGGGGLISGAAAALKALKPRCRIVGVEAAGADAMAVALRAGQPVALSRVDTIADGIAVKGVSALTLAHVQKLVDDVVTVDDEAISRALILLLERAKVVVEPAAAAPLAAVLAGRVGGEPGSPVGVLLSGGNVDPSLLARLIHHGLDAAGRYLLMRIVIADRPGELKRLLEVIAALGLNVIDVEHHRAGVDLPIDQVEVRLTLETRDPEHRDEARRALTEAGYRIREG
jgi:threonine dehydratase